MPPSRLLLATALLLAAGRASAAITIGPGPALGTDRAGDVWHEEFQDWSRSDLRALDRAALDDAVYRFHDGFDDSRDIVALYSHTEPAAGGDAVYFRVDLHDLRLGAENGHLDLYLALDLSAGGQPFLPDFTNCQSDRPWELCVALYSADPAPGTGFRIYDASFGQPWNAQWIGAHFDSELDAVEFGVRRAALLAAGWDGVSPFGMQVFTTNDGAGTVGCTGFGSKLTDAIEDADRGCADGVLNGATASDATAGFVWYATIAHGNQSVNQADDIAAHIFDPESNTGIRGGTGFVRALDTHALFRVPINLHPSGTLTTACLWAARPGGAADPQDGPGFIARIREFVDPDHATTPGALIGGVYAEHILPYFEGAVNALSLAVTDSLNQVVYGVSAADAMVMHTPERVIRSHDTGLAPLTGRTFADIAASPYTATVLDEVTHLHHWFYPGESCTPDAGHRHKLHRINGVHCFAINDREDQAKFGNHDGGAVLDTRFSLLQKAMFGGSSEIVVVFDDWEALAGKSFDATSGNSVPNNNPNQYHRTIRWLANHPWVRVATLREILLAALADPAAFVVDHGMRFDLPIQTYEWLAHASEDSYHHWYCNENAGLPGNEQDFYHLVPVISGPQGDYRSRGATPAQDGPPLPGGRIHGDLNTPGTLMRDTWDALQAAPRNRLRTLGEWCYLAMIYETAWHEEDALDYSDASCYGDWLHPDASWDGINTWALRLQNHVRDAARYAAAAWWADSVAAGTWPTLGLARRTQDVDLDGEAEYVLASNRLYAVFERRGGRCVLLCNYDPPTGATDVYVGPTITNPSAPGEEEFTGTAANRCSAFKDMNGGTYADALYAVTPYAPGVVDGDVAGWEFSSPDGQVSKTISISPNVDWLTATYTETLPGSLYVRFGLSPNPVDLFHHGAAHLESEQTAGVHRVRNTSGGVAQVTLSSSAAFHPSPADAGPSGRNLALTEQVEIVGDGLFWVHLRGSRIPTSATDATDPPRAPVAWARGPWPSPVAAGAPATLMLTLERAAGVRIELLDASGRRVGETHAGTLAAGPQSIAVRALGADGRPLPAGLYFVHVRAGGRVASLRWLVME